MGGSLAKALHNRMKVKITAVDKDHASLMLALKEGTIDAAETNIEHLPIEQYDIIIFCTPIEQTIQFMKLIDGKVNDACIVTDIGSTKEQVMDTAQELHYNFVGGHPMVGSEKYGYEHSKAHLYENAYFILTPPDDFPSNKINELQKILQAIGSIPVIMEPKKHDLYTAVISHVPHVIASALVHSALHFAQKDGMLLKLAAGGFKDITRIASSNPELWKHITLSNKRKISEVIDQLLNDVSEYKKHLLENNGEYISQYFSEAKETRDHIQDTMNTDIPIEYSLNVDIEDKPGMIARLSTLLYEHGINIKNIGIIHNREFVNGVLKIIFDNRTDQELAYNVLQKKFYYVYQ